MVKVYDGFFAKEIKKTGAPGCFFVSGLLAGIAEGLSGEGHNCLETKCMSAGDAPCEFVLTRRSSGT